MVLKIGLIDLISSRCMPRAEQCILNTRRASKLVPATSQVGTGVDKVAFADNPSDMQKATLAEGLRLREYSHAGARIRNVFPSHASMAGVAKPLLDNCSTS